LVDSQSDSRSPRIKLRQSSPGGGERRVEDCAVTPAAARLDALLRLIPLSIALVIGTIALVAIHPFGLFGDELAFYCGSSALVHGADPYLHASIFGCERDAYTPLLGAHHAIKISTPVVWPPYAIVAFAPFAMLPFGAGLALWLLLNTVAAASAARRLCVALPDISPWLINALIGITVLSSGLFYGQPTGILLLAIVALGSSYRRRSAPALAMWLALGAIQPHVALAGGLALLVAGGRWALRPVLGAGLIVALLSAFTPALDLEYVRAVLPAHEAANVLDPWQLAVPSALAQLGLAVPLAVGAGTLIYLVALAAAVFLGAAIARRTGRPEALPWIATLVGTFGAPHVHYQQIAAALPAAFLLIGASPAPLLATICAYGIAIPWGVFCTMRFGWAFAMLPAFGALRPSLGGVVRVAAVAAALLCVQIAVAVAFKAFYHPEGPAVFALLPPGALAERSWAAYIRWEAPSYTAALVAARLVTWISEFGLLVLCVVTACAAGRDRIARREPVPARAAV
jgi:hypothetical protein